MGETQTADVRVRSRRLRATEGDGVLAARAVACVGVVREAYRAGPWWR